MKQRHLLLMLFVLLGWIQAFSQISENYHGVHYKIVSKNEAYVVNYNKDEDDTGGNISIKSSIFQDKEYLVTKIDDEAFEYCRNIWSVLIPNTVKEIGDGSFLGCSGLKTLQLGYNVSKIGFGAFSFCVSLERLTFISDKISLKDGAFAGCTGLTIVESLNGPVAYGAAAFKDCRNLAVIPDSFWGGIGEKAFSGCTSLETIKIPGDVYYISARAFEGCTSLSSLTLEEGIEGIYKYAFSGCTSLTSVKIPKSVDGIQEAPFAGCNSLTQIEVDGENKFYDSREGCNAIIHTADNKLIQGCMNTVIPSSVTTIGSWAFENLSSLTEIIIPNSVSIIEGNAFKNCGLNSVSLPNGVISIAGAFCDCSNLTTAVIPESIGSLGSWDFDRCTNLKDVYLYHDPNDSYSPYFPKGINDYSFYDVPLENVTLHVPAILLEKYKNADYWKEFGHIVALTDTDPKPGDVINPSGGGGDNPDGGGPSGIHDVTNNNSGNTVYFDLSGRRVMTPQKGVYVKNGRKVIVK